MYRHGIGKTHYFGVIIGVIKQNGREMLIRALESLCYNKAYLMVLCYMYMGKW